MPSPIQNVWTLKKLIQNTYAHKYSKSRFDYKIRDLVKVIQIRRITVYDGKQEGKAKTRYDIVTQSLPQYNPYFTVKDRWGRKRSMQRKYRHEYIVIIQLDTLSIDVPFKGRVGGLGKWDFSKAGQSYKKGNRIIEGTNVQRGLNGDFFFRCSYLWSEAGILFGRNYATSAPTKTNPQGIIYAPKHFLAVVQYLMETGTLK